MKLDDAGEPRKTCEEVRASPDASTKAEEKRVMEGEDQSSAL